MLSASRFTQFFLIAEAVEGKRDEHFQLKAVRSRQEAKEMNPNTNTFFLPFILSMQLKGITIMVRNKAPVLSLIHI